MWKVPVSGWCFARHRVASPVLLVVEDQGVQEVMHQDLLLLRPDEPSAPDLLPSGFEQPFGFQQSLTAGGLAVLLAVMVIANRQLLFDSGNSS